MGKGDFTRIAGSLRAGGEDFIRQAGNRRASQAGLSATWRSLEGDACDLGSIENQAGTDLSAFSQAELDGIADSLNARPRATLNWHTPFEVFAQTLASSHQRSPSFH